MAKYGYSPSEVGDESGHRLVKSRTTTVPPAHVAREVYWVPTGATGEWATHVGEFAGSDGSAWIYEASPPDGLTVWIADEEVTLECVGGILRLATQMRFSFDAAKLLSPNNSDWKIDALAPLAADSNNAALSSRMFDDTTEEGVGLGVPIPPGAQRITIRLKSRAETAPAAARTVGMKLYNRGISATPEAWSAGTTMTDIDIPASELWQDDEETFLLSALGATAGEFTQFELTRVNPIGGTELSGDWTLLWMGLVFS